MTSKSVAAWVAIVLLSGPTGPLAFCAEDPSVEAARLERVASEVHYRRALRVEEKRVQRPLTEEEKKVLRERAKETAKEEIQKKQLGKPASSSTDPVPAANRSTAAPQEESDEIRKRSAERLQKTEKRVAERMGRALTDDEKKIVGLATDNGFSAVDEAKRLEGVAQEVRRRRMERGAAGGEISESRLKQQRETVVSLAEPPIRTKEWSIVKPHTDSSNEPVSVFLPSGDVYTAAGIYAIHCDCEVLISREIHGARIHVRIKDPVASPGVIKAFDAALRGESIDVIKLGDRSVAWVKAEEKPSP